MNRPLLWLGCALALSTLCASGNYNFQSLVVGNVNGVLNAATYPGADIGAQINAAVAALPTASFVTQSVPKTYPFGTVYVPNSGGVQSFSTQIGNSSTALLTFVKIQCEQGTQLQYTGSGPDAVYALDPYGTNAMSAAAGGIDGCTFIAAQPAPASKRFIHFGNTSGYKITNDTFVFLNGTGDSAVYIENTNYFTENYEFTGSRFVQNTDAVTMSENCGGGFVNCGNSFEHAKLNYYCGTAYGITTSCLKALNGAHAQYENLGLRFNLNGNTGSAAIYVDGTSQFLQNVGTVQGENDTAGTGYLLNVISGGYGEWNQTNAGCPSCSDAPQGSGIDVPLTAGPAAFGALLLANSTLSGTGTITQLTKIQSISCWMVQGGACTTPPTVAAFVGATSVGSVVCPSATGTKATTVITSSQEVYPGNDARVVEANVGTTCTVPLFTATVQLRAN